VLAVRDDERPGEPLLLLHGGPGVPDSLQAGVAPLLPDLRCISFDQRGVGRSTCDDGRYDLASYLEDVEAIRRDCGLAAWHVLGHSFGGLLAQAYAARHPERVKSLVLSSSSLGVNGDWKTTKRESFRIERRRAGIPGVARFYFFGSWLVLPGPVRDRGMRRLMAEVWHNYFLDPRSAPDPEPAWLAGASAQAMIATDRAISREDPAVLDGISSYGGRVLVLYGEHDIFGPQAQAIVRRRLPQTSQVTQVTLQGSGHLHWLQNREGYRETLAAFFAKGSDGSDQTVRSASVGESRAARMEG